MMIKTILITLQIYLSIIKITTKTQTLNIKVINSNILQDQKYQNIITNGQVSEYYDDTIFNNEFNCRNGYLNIILQKDQQQLNLTYNGIQLNQNDVNINISPNSQPIPNVIVSANLISINFNCPADINNYNYYNKVTVNMPNDKFTFLINCDPDHRHKKFEFGYLIISVMDTIIILSVAMHSYIWSIKKDSKPFSIELKWILFVLISLVGIILFIALYIFAINDITNAFISLQYFGIGISFFFLALCLNQIFFLIKIFREPVYKFIRRCQILSFIFASTTITLAILFQNWILYNILAVSICVGSIKLFRFTSLKSAFISMFISVITVVAIAILLHYTLSRSYNEYASQLSSPLFLQVPDLIENLYKQCSWLPVYDIIIPGVLLSYLRKYDENNGSKYGGVYTVAGNIAFILATALWVGLQSIYPFSIPFSLVTYLFLMLVIFLLAYRRNQWSKLYHGTFVQQQFDVNQKFLEQTQRISISQLLEPNMIKDLTRSIDHTNSTS